MTFVVGSSHILAINRQSIANYQFCRKGYLENNIRKKGILEKYK